MNAIRVKENHISILHRVRGSVQNNKDFARVFNCPLDKPMNPKEKCEIWWSDRLFRRLWLVVMCGVLQYGNALSSAR